MGELHSNEDNLEVKHSSADNSQPETAKPCEGDKQKLQSQENDADRINRENSEKNDASDNFGHPKLETNSGESHDTPEKNKQDTENSEHGKLNPEQPEKQNPEQSRDLNLDQPEKQNPEQSKEQKPEQPKEEKPEQPKEQKPEQPKEQTPEQEKPSIWDKIGGFFGRHKQPESASKEDTEAPRGSWEGMETAPHPNGSGWTLLPGNNFDKFSDIDKNYPDHPRTDLKRNGEDYSATVNPADIEGVYLGDTEVSNPDNFWRMHNGSKDAWMDTASHIPEVQDRLNNGESLDSLLDDNKLGPCANAYFNPNNPQAIEVDAMPDGGYMFNGNGRHRIIAAREYGYDIPVKVVGQRE